MSHHIFVCQVISPCSLGFDGTLVLSRMVKAESSSTRCDNRLNHRLIISHDIILKAKKNPGERTPYKSSFQCLFIRTKSVHCIHFKGSVKKHWFYRVPQNNELSEPFTHLQCHWTNCWIWFSFTIATNGHNLLNNEIFDSSKWQLLAKTLECSLIFEWLTWIVPHFKGGRGLCCWKQISYEVSSQGEEFNMINNMSMFDGKLWYCLNW